MKNIKKLFIIPLFLIVLPLLKGLEVNISLGYDDTVELGKNISAFLNITTNDSNFSGKVELFLRNEDREKLEINRTFNGSFSGGFNLSIDDFYNEIIVKVCI